MSGSALLFAALVAQPAMADAQLVSPPEASASPTIVEGLQPGGAIQGRVDTDERMTVDVRIGGRGPYRFLVDTGSQSTVVSRTLAGELGLAPGPDVLVMGMAGSQVVTTRQLGLLQIGPHAFRDLTVPLLDAGDLGADGLIGTDSLQDQRVVLDFVSNTIGIEEVPGAAAERRNANSGYEIIVNASRRLGRLILTNAMIDGVRTSVVIDTGASGTVGNAALQQALRKQPAGKATLTSVTGHDLPADLGIADRLHIGKLYVTNVSIAYAASPVFAELGLDKKPAIFLGMRELRGFKRIAIDFSKHKVLFDLPD